MLDTNVIFSAVRSRRGSSFQILSRVGTKAFDLAVSVPLVLEYEAALLGQMAETGLGREDVEGIIDYICRVAKRQSIFYLWRPLLCDPSDDMVVEVAVAAGCDALITHNRRDFDDVAAMGLRVLSPAEFLGEIRRSR